MRALPLGVVGPDPGLPNFKSLLAMTVTRARHTLPLLLHAGMQEAQRNMIMHLYHATAQLKSDTVAEYVTELLDTSHPDDKFLVFAFHRSAALSVRHHAL